VKTGMLTEMEAGEQGDSVLCRAMPEEVSIPCGYKGLTEVELKGPGRMWKVVKSK
jgi:hypothetical protein